MNMLSGSLLVVFTAVMQVSGAWVRVTANLSGQASACGNIYYIAAVPQKDKVILGVAGNKGLWATTDNGTSWQALGTASNWVDPNSILFDKDNPDIFWEIGMHGGGAYKTTNGGATFSALTQGNGDGIGVDFTDPLRKTIVIGAHEALRVAKSTDGGNGWTDITAGLSGNTAYPIVIDANTYILNSMGAGIFRTTNGGNSWTKVSTLFATWTMLVASDGAYYGVVGGNQTIIKSTDQGVSWTQKAKPATNIYSPCYTPIEMPDHSIIAIGSNSLVRTTNGGTSWSTIGEALPPTGGLVIQGIAYNSVSQSFFLTYIDCNSTVPANAIWRLGYPASAKAGEKGRTTLSHSSSNRVVMMAGNRSKALGNHTVARFDPYGRKLKSAVNLTHGIAIAKFADR